MAGALLERELANRRTAGVEFSLATEADDGGIRRLLRENPMPGKISLSLEREEDYFADSFLPGQTSQTIIARQNGRVVCAGNCVIRQRFINGQAHRVGYLGSLRLDSNYAGRFDIVRRGYEFFRELQVGAAADFYFTSIASDNERARSFLERGLPGMPRYEFVGEFVSLVLQVTPQTQSRVESRPEIPNEFLTQLNEHNRLYQFAPSWSDSEFSTLETLGLSAEVFRFIWSNGEVQAGAALWDQRAFRQIVVHGYARWLALVRPVLNLLPRAIAGPRLPKIGTALSNAFISHLALNPEKTGVLSSLISELLGVASQRGIELVSVGFAASDPRLCMVNRLFRGREYRSRLYVVRWPEIGGKACQLDGRVLAPEVALL